MNKKVMTTGIVFVCLLTACSGEQENKKESVQKTEVEAKKHAENKGIVAGTIESSVVEENDGSMLIFRIQNQKEKEVTLEFSSGAEYDFVITKNNEKQFQFSEGNMSTQALMALTLKPGERKDYPLTIPPFEKGKYELEVWSTAKNEKIEKTTHMLNIK